MATKIKNLEQVWTSLKKELPSYVKISKIDSATGMKVFDLIVPKSRIVTWPDGVKNKDLEFTFSWDSGLVIFLEEGGLDWNADTIEDALEVITYYIDMNESFKPNDAIVISTEDNTELKGFDKLITFETCGWNRNDLEKTLKKSNRKYFLEVYPSKEAGLYVANKDEKFFKDYLQTVVESMKENMNESEAVVAIGLIQHIDKDFVTTLSDDGLRNAILQIDANMKAASVSVDPDMEIYHREAKDKFDLLTTEFQSRGLPLAETFNYLNRTHAKASDDIVKLIIKNGQYINEKDMIECLSDILNTLKNSKTYKKFSDYYFKEI